MITAVAPMPYSDARTHAGCRRPNNQDRSASNPGAGVWMVADGMGGLDDGEYAAQQLADAFADLLSFGADFGARCAAVGAAIARANQSILHEAQRRGVQMGSTVVALILDTDRYAIQWVGDSRAYRIRSDKADRLTRDHSQAAALVAKGLLSEAEAVYHPSANILVRAVGVMPNVEIDQVTGAIHDDAPFLLCSDGLYNMVSDDEIAEIADRTPLNGLIDRLIGLALERGAPDNVTAVILSACCVPPVADRQIEFLEA
jgi:serine/threonine protein phosphatase Stp1